MDSKKINVKIKDTIQKIKRPKLLIAIIAILLVLALVFGIVKSASGKSEVAYKEFEVTKGTLTVGIEEAGSIAVGTTTQSLDLDISAYTSSTSMSFSNMNGQGGGPSGGGMSGAPGAGMSGGSFSSGFGGMSSASGSSGNMISGAGSNTSSGDRVLQVEAVYLAVGQEVKAGDPILKLTADSVDSIRNELVEDEKNAKLTYDQQVTENELEKLSAEQTLEKNNKYASYAETEYQQTLTSLNDAVETAQENLDTAKEDLLELTEELEEYNSLVSDYNAIVENAEYQVETTDMENMLYWWVVAENARENAQSMLDTLTSNIETTEENIESKKSEINQLEIKLASAKEDQEIGVLEAESSYKTATYNAQRAQELYDVTVGSSELTTEIAKDDYEKALAKLEDFDSVIQEQIVYAKHSGIVTEVGISAGDYIGTGNTLITVNDYDAVTVTIDIDESDIESAREGSAANVYVSALPEEYYTATVTEVGDATYDNSTGTTSYEVTVTLSGNTELLLESMTASVTLITKETQEVTYVSNRAIARENGKSYVKYKEADGSFVKKEVETGFSDGNNVEIISGLNVGDIVVIESTVGDK